MGGYGAIRNGLKYSETFNENHNFRDFLASENYDFIYEESSAVHNWKFWNEHIKKAFEWIDNN